jgi:hypothetical protein
MNAQTIAKLDHKRKEAVDAAIAHIRKISLDGCKDTIDKLVYRMELRDGNLLIEFIDNTCIVFNSYGNEIEEDCLGIKEAYDFGVLPDELYRAYFNAKEAREEAERECHKERVAHKTLKDTVEILGRDKVLDLLREQSDG